jgi:hypothetical protein
MAKSALSLKQVVEEGIPRLPRVVAYNRLEAQPRTTEFSRSLRAEVRDPLWMLTRQWQFGEFRGEDAASPISARIAYRHSRTGLISLRDGEAVRFEPETLPLEARVEREPIPFTLRELSTGEVFSDVLLAARWGKRLLRVFTDAKHASDYRLYLARFPLRVLPTAPAPPAERRVEDIEAEVIARSLAGQVADGVAVWRASVLGTHDAWLTEQLGVDHAALILLVKAFADACSQSVARLFTQPEASGDSAWVPNHLEYQFAVGPEADARQPSNPTLRAEQYDQGHLDWYSFDAFMDRPLRTDAEAEPAPDAQSDFDEERVESFLPAPVRFKGQPQPRFWEMEESQTDFGKIDTSTTGLLHLLLAEFALIHSNDWFMLPHPMEVNTICEVRGILVDDTFGRHTLIRAAGRGQETAWQRFAMFHLTEHGSRPDAAGNLFYLVPAVGKALESAPLERVNFMRDEMANMAWGVEAIVPSQTGVGMSGYEASRSVEGEPERVMKNEDVRIGYVLGTTVPENWIPFVPVHAPGSVSEVRLQRARMAGGPAPRGCLLREQKSPYFVEEEEIPRAGVYVERSWQRARWTQGRTLLWVGRRKAAGRGEGWSNLVFDRIRDLKRKDA